MRELWKDVPGFDGYYQASSLGRFKRTAKPITGIDNVTQIHRERMLTISKYRNGYARVKMSHKGVSKWYSAHRLIALTFIENPDNKPEVNHKDNDKMNNSVSNLEWCTRSENMCHARDNGHWKAARGVKHGKSKLNPKDVKEIRKLLENNISCRKVGERFNVHRNTISQIKNKITWQHI